MSQVREAILRNCQPSWRKVAMVIYKAHSELSLPDGDEAYDSVAAELVGLVEVGELEAVGNLSNWRRSEVRLPA